MLPQIIQKRNIILGFGQLKMASKKSLQIRQILSTCPKSKMPKDLEPMSPTLIPEPFNHADWQFEIKWDGFRMLAYCDNKMVNLRSKNNHSFNRKFPAVKTFGQVDG